MPDFTVKLNFYGSPEAMEGARVALQARLPDLRIPSDDLREAFVVVRATDSAEALKNVNHRIDTLPPEVADRIRPTAEPAT